MEQNKILSRLEELERQIAQLPAGSVSTKKINGKIYYYHRWTENKKRHEKYIPGGEVAALQEQIAFRKMLEKEQKTLRDSMPKKFMSLHRDRIF